MTLVLPSVSDLPAGYIVQAADLNAIGAACTFMLNKPISLIWDSAGAQAIGTAYPPTTDVSFASKHFDTDGMWSSGTPTRLTIQTPGFYKIWYVMDSQSAGGPLHGMLYCTTGSNNPLGAGVVQGPYWGSQSIAGTTVGTTTAVSGMWPFYLYAGDWLHLRGYATSGTMTTNTVNPCQLGAEWMSI